MDCIFCQIIADQAPTHVVHQTERLIAIKDINPQAPMHVLVIPREHAANAAETAATDPAMIGELVTAAHEIASEIGVHDYRMIFNTGPDAGQTVFHTHLHLLAGTKLDERLA